MTVKSDICSVISFETVDLYAEWIHVKATVEDNFQVPLVWWLYSA
jgi:hypothetical protein